MVASEVEVPTIQLVDKIGTKFQRLYQCFRGRTIQYRTILNDFRPKREWENRNPKCRPLNFQYIYLNFMTSTQFKRLHICFLDPAIE